MIDFTQNEQAQVVIGHSDNRHIADLIAFCKGWQKFSPFVGACLLENLSEETSQEALRANIATELTQDGATVESVDFEQDEHGEVVIKTEAHYA